MTITEPISDPQWGRGDWQDYINNWREKDAEYLQARTILRYHNASDRAAQWASPAYGQVTYNETALQVAPGVFVDRPEMFSKQHNKWVALLMLDNITSTKDDAAGVALSHKQAGGKGVIFGPGSPAGTGLLEITSPLNVMTGVMLVDGTGVTVKTGTKSAKLTTDANNLISDTPISAPSLISGGALSVTGALTAASVTTPTATVTTLTVSGTLTGGILNGPSGTIGGVALASSIATASSGFVSQAGLFQGDGSSALMRYRNPSGGAVGTAYFQVATSDINFGPTNSSASVYMYPYLRIMQGRGVPWHNTAGTHVAWISPTIVSGGDPGAGNYPDGTVWVQP